jgi:hypothetical protein
MVLRRCLPMETSYIPGLVVDREVALECKCDTFVEPFVVHSSNIGQVGLSCQGRFYAMFINYLIVMSLMCRYNAFLL